jgi:hypothetical protein
MSWSVSIGNIEANHTYNTSGMIKTVCGSAPSEWKGMNGKDLIPVLAKGILALRSDSEKYRELEPENKWGTVESTIEFLEEIERGCRSYPNEIIGVF